MHDGFSKLLHFCVVHSVSDYQEEVEIEHHVVKANDRNAKLRKEAQGGASPCVSEGPDPTAVSFWNQKGLQGIANVMHNVETGHAQEQALVGAPQLLLQGQVDDGSRAEG